jgi:hypothetical protein
MGHAHVHGGAQGVFVKGEGFGAIAGKLHVWIYGHGELP